MRKILFSLLAVIAIVAVALLIVTVGQPPGTQTKVSVAKATMQHYVFVAPDISKINESPTIISARYLLLTKEKIANSQEVYVKKEKDMAVKKKQPIIKEDYQTEYTVISTSQKNIMATNKAPIIVSREDYKSDIVAVKKGQYTAPLEIWTESRKSGVELSFNMRC